MVIPRQFPILLLALLTLPRICLAESQTPNLVMIISDDQTWSDFGFMGNPHVKTPHLDRLASKSARYVNGYVPSSVCSPSLATLLTGLYPHQHGIHFNHPPPGNAAFNRMTSVTEYEKIRSRSFRLIQSVPTLPRLLAKKRGYRCLQTGKFWEGHYSNAGFTRGMTIFKPVPGQKFGGNRTLANGNLAAHGNGDWGLKIGRETMKPIFDFIDASDEKPFFVWYAPYLPHQPHDSPKKYYDLYKNDTAVPKHRMPYYASISQFDDTVGELIQYVEKKGLAKQTLFVFVVDNGWEPDTRRMKNRPQEFQHRKRSKRAPFDFGLRTPILLRWDGRIKPATHRGLVSSIDLMPTILKACDCPQPKKLPGVNLLPSALGKAKLDPERAVFGEIYPGDASTLGNPSRDVAYRWVRKGDLKLITTHSHQGNKPWGGYLKGDALFNLETDRDESVNLISKPAEAKNVAELRRLLNEWWTPTN